MTARDFAFICAIVLLMSLGWATAKNAHMLRQITANLPYICKVGMDFCGCPSGVHMKPKTGDQP